ncbi:hypothetical protein DXD16_07830 [Collinsella sp. TF11-5AC]|nr:hypothetical protein DXD16_07830 [Collinsella sp. TF11-5AC]
MCSPPGATDWCKGVRFVCTKGLTYGGGEAAGANEGVLRVLDWLKRTLNLIFTSNEAKMRLR